MKEHFDLNMKRARLEDMGASCTPANGRKSHNVMCRMPSHCKVGGTRKTKLFPSLPSQFDLYKQTRSSYIIYKGAASISKRTEGSEHRF